MAPVTVPPLPTIQPGNITLHDVPWELYCSLRDLEANNAIRMIYLDGDLTLMSPALKHDGHEWLLGKIVQAVSIVLGLEIRSAGSTTLRLKDAPDGGTGKEPDTAFFIGADELRMRGQWEYDLGVDPPPSLAIEVEHSHDLSAAAMTVYARLGVPEVWRYRVRDRTLGMSRLVGKSYQELGRSVVLPKLTPALVVEALARYEVGDIGENAWFEWLRVWAQGLPVSGK